MENNRKNNGARLSRREAAEASAEALRAYINSSLKDDGDKPEGAAEEKISENAEAEGVNSVPQAENGGVYAANTADAAVGSEAATENNRAPQKEEEPAPRAPKLPLKYKIKKFFYELGDLLKGAVFPFIVMCVFSSTIILFYGFDDIAVRILAVVLGDGLLIASCVMFGRQNGAAAYRKFKINDAKRKLGKREPKVVFKTGEYSPWKGFVIGFITAVPFLIFQIIKCFGEFMFVNFMLEYACGWAVAPLQIISDAIPQPYYLLMIIFPAAIHGAFYIQGMYAEKKRQEKINRAEDDMRKGKKKHYYEENVYEPDRTVVDIPEDKRRKSGR